MKELISIIVVLITLSILCVQAYSDHKTMLLFRTLNSAGVIITSLAAVVFIEKESIIFIIIALAMNWMQGIFGAYSKGDAKVYTMIIFIISLFKSNIDILIFYLWLEIVAIVIFFFYTMVCKMITKQKNRKKYPYIPSVLFATIICIIIEIIITIF